MENLDLTRSFDGVFEGRKVLVTGHTGFKGSWLCLWLTALGARVTGLALAPETEPAHWSLLRLESVADHRVDLLDADSVRRTLESEQPEIVFHLAAQALVRRSYREPLGTFQTNVIGLLHLFEAVRAIDSVRILVNATTDKVYMEQATASGYREDHPLGGHDPYSTSKACAELVSDCYRKSFFAPDQRVRLATARAGNVIGGGDWSEDRLLPDLVRAATSDGILRIRNPEAVRPWQHVLEPLSGYLCLAQALLEGRPVEGAWNFGPAPDATLPVKALVTRIQAMWPDLRSEIADGPHPHEAATLRLECDKGASQLAWRPVWSADTCLDRTIRWYRNFHERGELCSADDLQAYIVDARVSGVRWAT